MCDLQDMLWKLLPVFTSFGVLILGSWLTVRARRREWIADNRKEEYRKVLASLNRINMIMISLHTGGVANLDQNELQEAVRESTEAVNTCLFINDFMEKSQVLARVISCTRRFTNGGSFEEYHAEYWKAINQILDSAKKL